MNLADALWLKSASALFETCPTWASRLDELRRLIENSSSAMVLRVPTDLHFGCESSKRVQCGEPDTTLSVLTRARPSRSEANSNAQRINEAESPRFLRQLDCNSTDSSTQTKIQNQWPAFYTNSSAFQCGQTTSERGECPHQPPAPEPGRG